MVNYSELPLNQLLEGFSCPCCGKRHETQLKVYRAGPGVIAQLPEAIGQAGVEKPFVVCDKNTYAAAGERAMTILRDAGVEAKLYVLPMDEVEPDEIAVGALSMAYDPSCDGILAVGSGVINDICKVVARTAGVPSMVVGTAPSMDGYASNSSSMHVNGVKTTLYNACPTMILCDTDIVSQAPMRMLWSGLGDMIAKYISILEWRIANLVVGEEYCETLAQLVRRSLKKCVDNADKLASRDPEAIEAVFEGLVLSGVAMAFANSSRPASGGEHYFSHMWEMMAMERHTKADFHGIQVGVGTMLSLELYDWVKTLRPNRRAAEIAMEQFKTDRWSDEMLRIFGQTSGQILAIEQIAGKNDPVKHEKRLDRILGHWDEILGFIEAELPSTENMKALMRGLGAPMTPADLGICTEDVKDAFIGSREIRDKYILSSVLWDLGLQGAARGRLDAQGVSARES